MIPALIGALGAIGSTMLTNQANKANSESGYQMQKDYNQWLLSHQTQEHVKDARSAGLNPAFMNGSQLGSTPSPPSYTPPTYNSPLDLSSAMIFGKTIADTRLTNAQARAQELANKDKESKNKVIADTYKEGVWTLDGKVISDDEANKIMMSSGDSVNLPEFSMQVLNPEGAEGRLEGEKLLKRWDKEVSDIDVGKLHNQLETMVTQGQITNPRVIQALQKMPYWTYKDLIEKVNNAVVSRANMNKQGDILDLNKVMIKLDTDIKRDSNLNQYIDKIKEGTFDRYDLLKVIVMGFVNLLRR